MKIHMFPGQGSQSRGMGGELFDRFQDWTSKADRILGYSVRELCLEDPRDELGNTQFTQPALYVVNAMAYRRQVEDSGTLPDFLIGHSLGEFNALLAAGCFDFETGLKLVQRRGELMGQVSGGAMAAVMNSSREEIDARLAAAGLTEVYLANYNTPSQIVLSGLFDQIAEAETLFQEGKMRYYPLATSGAFHSGFMRDAMTQFSQFIQQFDFAEPRVPVIANVTARPYQAATMFQTLSSQIASTVRWCESVQYLLALARRRGATPDFVELGNGDVLTRMAFTIKAQTPDAILDAILEADVEANVEADFSPIAGEEPGADAPRQVPAGPVAGHAAIDALADVRDKVGAWNRAYPVGTRVHSRVADYDSLVTRTEAMVLFGHRAAVYMQGYNGYFDLNELAPA